MADFVGAVDQGTTSTRFMIFDHDGNEVGRHQLEHEQILPQAGWVEHDPVEIWERTSSVIQTALRHGRARRRRPRRARHHQPARDHRGVGPAHRPPVLQRDRLAGHPHRPHRLRARPRRPRRRDPPQGRAAAGDLLLRRQDPVDPGERRRRARGGRARATRSSATPTRWLLWNLTGGADGGVHVTDVDQRQPHHADEPGDPRLGRRAAGVLRHPARDAARDPAVVATRTATARPWRTARSAARCRSPATSATSRRPPSARSASRPARPRTPTAPATSCCSTPAPSWSAREHGLLTTVCYQFGDDAAGLRPGGLDRGHRLGGAVAARPARHHLRRRGERGAGPAGRGQRRRLLRAGVLRAVRAVLALRRPRRDRRAVPLQHQRPPGPGHAGGDLLPEPRRRRGDGAGLRRRRSRCSRSTAA